jgi:acyl-[acyl-carrier-protein]-phospholipid O-acyltransferase/long-chain-fatty-acid--[acyl-carrier-protein] ligase
MKNTFKWLNICQFTGALNDNAFKMTAAIVLVNRLGATSLPTVLAICSVLFVVPFLLFSNFAGTLADRFSKRDILIAGKWLEVGLLILAFPALLSGLNWAIYALLFFLCAQSALFGPAKRGIVPELVDDADLSRANGQLTAATYTAVILGTALPALVIGYLGQPALTVIAICLILSIIGTLASHKLARVPAAGSSKTSSPWIIPDVVRTMKNLKSDNWARQAVFGLILFDFITAFFQQTLVLFGQSALNLSVEKAPMLFPLAAVGIGIGALLTGRFSKHTIEIGLIPVGALGVMFSAIGLSSAGHRVRHVPRPAQCIHSAAYSGRPARGSVRCIKLSGLQRDDRLVRTVFSAHKNPAYRRTRLCPDHRPARRRSGRPRLPAPTELLHPLLADPPDSPPL